MNLKGKMYGINGNEIKIPEGHQAIVSKNNICFIESETETAKFIYKPPDENHPKYALAKKILNK